MRIAKPRECIHCHAPGLYWKSIPNRRGGQSVVMVDSAGIQHRCDEYFRNKAKIQPTSFSNTPKVAESSNEIDLPKSAEENKLDSPPNADNTDNNQSESNSQQDGSTPQESPKPQPKDLPESELWKALQPYSNRDIDAKLAKFSPKPSVDKSEVSKIAKAIAQDLILEQMTPPVIEHVIKLETSDGPVVIDGAHFQTEQLLRYLGLGLNVMLVGPAGSGKTHAAHQAAKLLSLLEGREFKYYPQSVGPQTSKSDLIGYMDAHGKLVSSPLREAYANGGVYLLDEIDAANAGVLTILNAALSNSVCSFPDGTIERHVDFRCIAAANTYGLGASRMYVGRNQLDAATLNRFVGIDWDYDKAIETKLSLGQQSWLEFVWKLRDAQNKLAIRCVFSTRQVIDGAKMLNAGIARTEVENARVWFGVSADDKAKLLQAIQ